MSYRTQMMSYFGSRDRGWLLSLFAAVVLVYMPFLGSPFVFDDVTLIMSGGLAKYADTWFHFDLRWLPYASLAWTEALFSNVVTHFFHLGNLLLHVTNAILLFYLLRQLMAAIDSSGNAAMTVWGAWFAALIFALHPVAVYAAGYVVQRSILMATMFSLLTLLMYLRGMHTGQSRWLLLAVLAYFLAVFSKEHSVMLPVVLAALAILLRGRNRAKQYALSLSWLAIIVIAVMISLRAKGVFGLAYEPMAAALFEQQGVSGDSTLELHILSALTQAGLFFKYLGLWLLPNPAWMSVDMRVPYMTSLSDWQGWLGGAGFVLYGLGGGWLLLRRGRAGLLGWALLYPWLQFLLEFSSIRVQEPFVLYRSYLWMPGMLLLIPLLLTQWPGKWKLVILGAIALILASAAANRLWVFADDYRLWDDAARLLPGEAIGGADRIYFNRGQAEKAKGLGNDAIADFERVVAINPKLAQARFELGWAYAAKGRYQESLTQFDAAIHADPDYANAYYGKALVEKHLGKPDLARELLVKSCELKQMMACLLTSGRVSQ